MSVTFVSYYGVKPTDFSDFIRLYQTKVASYFGNRFHPYSVEQVHGTIVGLEGEYVDNEVINKNFKDIRGEKRPIKFKDLFAFFRSTNMLSIQVQIGGFNQYKSYGFSSNKKHPYHRSFSILGDIVLVMGWPVSISEYPNSLDNLRRRFQDFNVLHRYHKSPNDIDNDYYFVIGRIDRASEEHTFVQEVEESIRDSLSKIQPLVISIEKGQCSIVNYTDTRLPLITTSSFLLSDMNEQFIRELYFH